MNVQWTSNPMRKLWHRLFGHGHTHVRFNYSKSGDAYVVCVCEHKRPVLGYTTADRTGEGYSYREPAKTEKSERG